MRFGRLATGPVFGLALLCATQMAAQEQFAVRDQPLESRIWLDRGTSPVLRRGDLVRVFYRASRDAYVSIFHVDTNGFARLLHPGSPTDDHVALGGRDYRVLFPESRYWQVDEDEGKGYLFVVASPAPLDFSDFAYSRYQGGWNLGALAQAPYRDPFLMMEDLVAALIPDSGSREYALDFVAYDIDRPHDYPRFLCYQCHGFRPMFDWNPYARWCTDFRVVIHDDPYYYPVYRYSGDRVVYTRPLEPSRPMFEFQPRAAGEAATPLIRTRSENGPGGDTVREPGFAPTARVPGLGEPVQSTTGVRAEGAAPPEGSGLPARVVRPGLGVPAVAAEPRPGGGGRVPVEVRPAGPGGVPEGQPAAAVGEVRVEGVDPVVSREPVEEGVTGAPPAALLPAASSRPDGSLPDAAATTDAAARPDAVAPPAARAAEGGDERPVLRRRGEPPPAGSAPPPGARPGTPPGEPPPPSGARPGAGTPPGNPPPGEPPPPSAGRPPPQPVGSAVGSSPDRPPATRSPAAVRSGPPPRSSGPPPARTRTRPPGGPPVM